MGKRKEERGKRKEERGKSCLDSVCFGGAAGSLHKLKLSVFYCMLEYKKECAKGGERVGNGGQGDGDSGRRH